MRKQRGLTRVPERGNGADESGLATHPRRHQTRVCRNTCSASNASIVIAPTTDLLRADTDVLDAIAAAEADRLGGSDAACQAGWPADALTALPDAIRHRVLRRAALAAGCPAGALSQRHVASLDELVTEWHGQRWADLPGGVRCQRRYGRLLFTRAGASGGRSPG